MGCYGGKEICLDNVPIARFFQCLKHERVQGARYNPQAEAEVNLFDCIRRF